MFQKLTWERDPKATRAELRYSVERLLYGASLVRVALVTGLQNQIRVQLSALGHPVIGDRKYHPEEASERRISRVALHAVHLGFTHPRSGQNVSIDCENTWTELTADPTPREAGCYAAIKGQLYVAGGNNGSLLALNEAYDPKTKSWATLAPIPQEVWGAVASAEAGGRMYCLGGGHYQQTVYNYVQIYQP
jgi:hypothetical protein